MYAVALKQEHPETSQSIGPATRKTTTHTVGQVNDDWQQKPTNFAEFQAFETMETCPLLWIPRGLGGQRQPRYTRFLINSSFPV